MRGGIMALIKGDRIYLGAIEEDDSLLVWEWLNEFEVRRSGYGECPLPESRLETGRWIEEINSHAHSGLLAIRRIAENDLIGIMTIRKLSWVSRSVRFGILIWPPPLWNQGLCTEARRIFLDYAFTQLGMRRVFGSFADFNAASRRSHEKLGAHISAEAYEAVFLDNRYSNRCHYTYHREDYCQPPEPENVFAKGDVAPEQHILRDYQRILQDFYQISPCPDERMGYFKKNVFFSNERTQAALLTDPLPKSADLLFGSAVDADLASRAIAEGFEQLNLHRIQLCLPGTASAWKEEMIGLGFRYEGLLDGVCFANGRYFDLVIMGKLREE
jgi:RimJ/RimL family protein N-acetyltransferase